MIIAGTPLSSTPISSRVIIHPGEVKVYSTTILEAVDISNTISRTRSVPSQINETNNINISLSRPRSAASQINETLSLTGPLSRSRSVVSNILEKTTISVSPYTLGTGVTGNLPACPPTYLYRPSFIASAVDCIAPTYQEHRARIFAGQLFIRSKLQSVSTNSISIQITSATATIYGLNGITYTYPITLGPGGIAALRTSISSNPDVEMSILGLDTFDTRTQEDDTIIGLEILPLTSLSGGSGGPTNAAGLGSIRTGPDRSIIIIASTEDYYGNSITPPSSRRIQQWNGSTWISYCNNVVGQCPSDGSG